jgi:hypothetical protein
LSWFGHVRQRANDRMVKKLYEWKPKITREDDVEEDLRIMKINNWTKYIRYRIKWNELVEGQNFQKLHCIAWMMIMMMMMMMMIIIIIIIIISKIIICNFFVISL